MSEVLAAHHAPAGKPINLQAIALQYQQAFITHCDPTIVKVGGRRLSVSAKPHKHSTAAYVPPSPTPTCTVNPKPPTVLLSPLKHQRPTRRWLTKTTTRALSGTPTNMHMLILPLRMRKKFRGSIRDMRRSTTKGTSGISLRGRPDPFTPPRTCSCPIVALELRGGSASLWEDPCPCDALKVS
jgi:hypothetical protein